MTTTDVYYQQIHDNDLGTVLAHAETLAEARRALSRLRQQKRLLVAMRREIARDIGRLTLAYRGNPLPALSASALQVQAERDATLHDYQRLHIFVADLIETISAEQIILRQWSAEQKRESMQEE